MGGGEGAKERRRLKRLQKTGSGEEGTAVKKFQGRPKFEGKGKPKFIKKTGGHFSPNNKNKFSNGGFKKDNRNSPKGKPGMNKDVKKRKKPKHLKRKLEQLGEDDTDAREKLLNQINAFEEKKAKFSFQNKRHKASEPQEEAVPKSSLPTKMATDDEDDASITPKVTNDNHTLEATKEDKENEEEISSEQNNDRKDDDSSDGNSSDGNSSDGDSSNDDSSDDDSNDDDSSDDDSDNEDKEDQPRQRGRRRRGRKDTSKHIEEVTDTSASKNNEVKSSEGGPSESTSASKEEKGGKRNRRGEDDGRYCIGRKPVTDFEIGKSYPAKVVYVKPFGVFFDIGCHSDAFCHVSRLSDDYVEDPGALFHEGKQVEARIVEIDRKQKRLTVSLQSSARLEDEKASIEARKIRKEAMKSKSGKKSKPSAPAKESRNMDVGETFKAQSDESKFTSSTTIAKPIQEAKFDHPDESTMTPAELKRARKLARRAARRAAAEAADE